ncbi:type II toxin-antitoxin system death-on-curing family toxin [Dermacoccaceae bacterium W4C1]
MTRYLTTEDLLLIIEELGVGPIQDLGALDSAAHRPAATVLGRDAYPDLMLKAAVLLESLVRNHPLVDGNKRLGWTSTVVFLALNDNALKAPEDPAYDLVIATSQGQARPEQIAAHLAQWCATAGPTS